MNCFSTVGNEVRVSEPQSIPLFALTPSPLISRCQRRGLAAVAFSAVTLSELTTALFRKIPVGESSRQDDRGINPWYRWATSMSYLISGQK